MYTHTYRTRAYTDSYAYHGEVFEIHDECEYRYNFVMYTYIVTSDSYVSTFQVTSENYKRTSTVSTKVVNLVVRLGDTFST